MYTELKEVCNFLCRYLHFRIPQVKVRYKMVALPHICHIHLHSF